MRVEVRTQEEFDAAWAEHSGDINCEIAIVSARGVWIHVTASGSATVRAYGSATVTASGLATVRAYDSATVTASGLATVRASSHVAVHLHSARVTVSGGVVIDVTSLDQSDPATWAEYTGALVKDGQVILHKAVDAGLNAGHGYTLTNYAIGTDVTTEDWRPSNECGHGLHASPHAWQALEYAQDATRMLLVSCPLADLRPIPGDPAKAKARTFHVLREVNLDGSELS
jgi:hypothetical protein